MLLDRLRGAEGDGEGHGAAEEVGDVQRKGVAGGLVDEPEFRHGAGHGHGDAGGAVKGRDRVVDGVIDGVVRVGVVAVVAAPVPLHPVLIGQVLVDLFYATAFNAAKGVEVALVSGQFTAEAPSVHLTRHVNARLLVGPQRSVAPSAVGTVGPERHAHRVEADAFGAHGEQAGVAAGEDAERVVAHHAAGAEQNGGDLLVGNVVGPRLQVVEPGGGEDEVAVLHGQAAALQPHQAVAVGVRHAGTFEAEASFERHRSVATFEWRFASVHLKKGGPAHWKSSPVCECLRF